MAKLVVNYGRTDITFFATFIGSFVHLIASYVFIVRNNLGITGTGYAAVCTFTTQLIVLVIAICCSEMKKCLVYPDSRIFSGFCEFLKIALPNTIMLVLDWWVWELMMIFSGWLGVIEQATQIILMNITAMAYMAGIGLE